MHNYIVKNFFKTGFDKLKHLLTFSRFNALVLGIFVGFPAAGQIQTTFSKLNEPPKSTVEEKLAQLTLEDKVGQLFIFGFPGKRFDLGLKKRLTRVVPGSLILFSRNISSTRQVLNLNTSLQKHSNSTVGLPFFLMVDQEGGAVARIKTRPTLPSALALGSTKSIRLSESAGQITGKLLRLLGFNTNLAPVVDLSDPTRANFLGNRSFGNDPKRVSYLADSYAQGLYKAGIIPTYKHFPGHGGIIQDSHRVLPRKLGSLEEMLGTDLWPFRMIAESIDPSMIMVAHVAFPNIDESGLPATYSKKLITDILRNQFGYNGLIITDDLEMSGAKAGGGVGTRAIKAIKAGADMVMVGWSRRRQLRAYEEVLTAVRKGEISEERLNQSVRRIIQTKSTIAKSDRMVATNENLKKKIAGSAEEIKQLSEETARFNVFSSLKRYEYLKGKLGQRRIKYFFSATYRPFKLLTRSKEFRPSFVLLKPKLGDLVSPKLKSNDKDIAMYYISGKGTARIANSIPPSVRSRVILVNTTHPGTISNPHSFLAVINVNTKNYQAPKWISNFFVHGKSSERKITSQVQDD